MSGPTPSPVPRWRHLFEIIVIRLLSRSWFYLALGLGIFGLDLMCGRFFSFPILYVLPVVAAGSYCSARVAYLLAVLLPIGRLILVMANSADYQMPYQFVNQPIRLGVLVLIAYLVSRSARQTRELQTRVDAWVTICAWSRTVKYEGEWISFEQYLLRRFNLNTSHGICPAEAARLTSQSEAIEKVDQDSPLT
jgi:hypothetical protein